MGRRTLWRWGCLLMPFVLVYKSIVVYLLPCFGVYFARVFGGAVQVESS
jgi:hypothetical protein